MPTEQVNAWENYGQTAVSARHLSYNKRPNKNGGGGTSNLLPRSSRHSLTNIYDLGGHGKITSEFFQALSVEEGGSSYAMKLQSDEIKEKKLVLSDSVVSDIHETFPGFFEDVRASARSKQKKNSHLSFIRAIDATMPWVQTYLKSEVLLFFEMCLRGVCQIYFQNNPVSGLLFLAGLFVQSTRIALHGVIGVLSSTLCARLLGFDKGLASSGLFGYNGVLAGLAIATFDTAGDKHSGYKLTTILATIIFSSTTSIILVVLGKLLVPYKSPPLTLPFNISVICFLLAIAGGMMGHVDYDPVQIPSLPDYSASNYPRVSPKAFFAGTIRGVGQVCLCDSILAGCLILAGIAVCSRISAVAAIVGSGLGAALALLLGVPGSEIEAGMFGFNASLSFTAMYMFYAPSVGATVLATLAAGLTVIAQLSLATALQPLGLPFMTLPFCVVALAFILIQGTTSIVIAVPLESMTTPEDHLKRVQMLSDGFHFLRESIVPENASRTSTVNSRKVAKSLNMIGEAVKESEILRKSTHTKNGPHSDHSNNSGTRNKHGCFGQVNEEAKVKEMALSIFNTLDRDNEGCLPLQAIIYGLQVAGMSDDQDMDFAALILSLMDPDDSGSIDAGDFCTFAIVSKSIHIIQNKLSKFFDFVDMDSNGEISFDEINAALDYLGESRISQAEMAQLHRLTDCREESIGIILLTNAVTVAKVKVFFNAYHGSEYQTEKTNSVSERYRSAGNAA